MARIEHGGTSIADNYARTLLELTETAGNSDGVLAEFLSFVNLMERDEGFGHFMTSAAVDAEARRQLLEKHFRGKLTDVLLSTLQVVNRRGRCLLIPVICERYRLKLEAARNEVDVHVTSAVSLSDDLRQQVRVAATRVAGKTARLVEKVDPSILGGLVIKIGDEKLDGSVSRRLHLLRDMLQERASREIHSGKEYYG